MFSTAKYGIKTIFRIYRMLFSPFLHLLGGAGAGCRFEPSCSRYCEEAMSTHGSIRGMALGFRRVMRCHPWGGRGWGPVPAPSKQREEK